MTAPFPGLARPFQPDWQGLLDNLSRKGTPSRVYNIETIQDAKRAYGSKIAVLGGIDVDFLCRSDEASIRRRVRETIDACQPGGGFCLGTGNTVANYIPLGNYLAMIDEGRVYGG
jgi:uroporphyrinogen decarboxylase